jgi:hypothetical protein
MVDPFDSSSRIEGINVDISAQSTMNFLFRLRQILLFSFFLGHTTLMLGLKRRIKQAVGAYPCLLEHYQF